MVTFILISQHTSPNVESKVIKAKGSGHVPNTHKVIPTEKKWKIVLYQKPTGTKTKQKSEEISTTDLMINKMVNDLMILTCIFPEIW